MVTSFMKTSLILHKLILYEMHGYLLYENFSNPQQKN